MRRRATVKVLVLHLGILAALFLAQFVLPPYHHTNAARIMVMASYAVGYNLALGYTGLLSLGHAMFFAAGLYGAGLSVFYLGFSAVPAFGVPVRSVYATVFALGAMLAAIAGVLVVPIQQAHYLMGLDPLLLSFIVVVLGGLGSLRGTVVAAFVIGLGDGVISVFFSPTLAKILATLLVALVLVIRPGGLFGEDEP